MSAVHCRAQPKAKATAEKQDRSVTRCYIPSASLQAARVLDSVRRAPVPPGRLASSLVSLSFGVS